MSIPFAGFHARIGLRYGARDGDEKREGMLRSGNSVPARRVHDDNPAFRRGVYVHVVDTHPGPADDFELLCGLKDRGGHLGLAANDQRGEFRNDLDDLGLGQTRLDNNLKLAAGGELIQSALGHGIGHQNSLTCMEPARVSERSGMSKSAPESDSLGRLRMATFRWLRDKRNASRKRLPHRLLRPSCPSVKWSFRIATVAGIQVQIHFTFLLLLGFYAWIYYTEGGLDAAMYGVAFTLLIFLCVLLHEFGHAFAAKAFGIRTPDITLLPIGGVARLERMPANPWQELVIAVAGPAVNVVIAIAVFLLIGGVLPWHEFPLIDSAGGSLLTKLLLVNVLLVAFNLIPAFPMDGGRVLRALLATQMRYAAATRLAARVGQVIAVLFVVASLTRWGGPMLALIAAFVFLGAQQELAYARLRETAQGLRVGQAMITRFHTLPTSLKVAEIANTFSQSNQESFPSSTSSYTFRIASREELQRASTQLPPEASASSSRFILLHVGSQMRFRARPGVMRQLAHPLPPVVQNASGQIVGLLKLGQLAELSALRQPA